MIKYQLVCKNDHTFESWFQNSVGYDRMVASGAVRCPVCGSAQVAKALMAPYLSRGGLREERCKAPPKTDAPQSQVPALRPSSGAAEVLGVLLRRMCSEIEKTCDNVGDRFAEEARRIHYGEVEARGIYGETSPGEVEALQEEGVEFYAIPWQHQNA